MYTSEIPLISALQKINNYKVKWYECHQLEAKKKNIKSCNIDGRNKEIGWTNDKKVRR